MDDLRLSALPKTWIIDLDGVIFRHNSHLTGPDVLLDGVKAFFGRIPAEDSIVIFTAREERFRAATLASLQAHGLRWTQILFGLPVGERICINDRKPSGLAMSHAVNLERDRGLADLAVAIDPSL